MIDTVAGSAWEVHRLGPPATALSLVHHEERPTGPGEVTVEIAATALGFPDYLLCRGKYHDVPALPFVIGGEAAGRVAAVGDGVKTWRAGDRVIVAPGGRVGGLLAERVTVPADRLLPVSDEMELTDASALFVAYQTAYMALVRRAVLQGRETLLVHGASGGVGSAAVQLGKALGAEVIATASNGTKAAACERLGADHVIDTSRDDFVAIVRKLTKARGANVIFDPVGGDVFHGSRRCVAVEGRILVVGFASGAIPNFDVNHALLKNYAVVGFRTRPFRDDLAYRNEVHEQILGHVRSGAVHPLVEQVPFASAPEAVQRLGNRDVIGRLVCVSNASEVRDVPRCETSGDDLPLHL